MAVSGECAECGAFGENVRALDWEESGGLWRPTSYRCTECGRVWEVSHA